MYFCVFVLFLGLASSAKLPKDIAACKKSDPNVKECLRDTTEKVMQALMQGDSTLSYPSLDPILVESLVIGEGKGPVNVEQVLKNVKLHGLQTTKVISIEPDFDKNVFKAETFSPNLYLEADYEMKGKVLLLPVQGEGKCNITMVNAKIHHVLEGSHVQKNGEEYYKIDNYKMQLNPERVYYQFDNLFNGDPKLGPEINRVLNENWSEIFEDVRSGYEESFGIVYKSLANKLFQKVPYKDAFLE